MIVKCASCQTRFKIGDEKVTARGVKVRCTKCGTIFRVTKDPPADAPLSRAATPLEDLVGPPSEPQPAPGSDALENIFQSMVPEPTGAGQSQDWPPESEAPSISAPPPVPADVGSEPLELADGDAFNALNASLDQPPPPMGRPESNGRSPLETLATLDDPFDLPLDPLGKNKTPMPVSSRAQLEDDPFAAFAAAAPPSGAPATDSLPMELGSSNSDGFVDPLAGLNLDPGGGSSAMSADFPPVEGAAPEIDTAWEIPRTDAPREGSSVRTSRPPSAVDSPLELAGQTTKVVGNLRPPSMGDGVRGTSPGAREEAQAKGETPLATRLLNAIASISIVVLALLIFVIWRNGGRVDLREPGTAFLAAFGVHRPVPVSQSFPATISGSGLYRSSNGLPLLFVRGRVQNLTQRPQRVRVRLTVEDSGRVAAESEAWPTTVPTPFELYGVRSSSDLKMLQRAWDENEPPPLSPQSDADFMVVTADLPTNLGSLLLKVTAVPQLDATDAAPKDHVSPAKPAVKSGARAPVSPSAATRSPLANGATPGGSVDPSAP